MAKEFSIKGVLEFLGVDEAGKKVKQLNDRVSAMKKNTEQIGKGASQLSAGLKPVGAAAVVVSAGFGMAIKEAADFEQAMANLNSVNELTTSQFRALELQALKLGSTTTFSAKEAAEGMFELTKAGLTVEQTMQAIPGVLSAAATEGLQLAQASEIVVGVLQGQNMKMTEATRVADALAKTANATSAGMVDLGEAFKYANQLASAGLVTFDDTAASLGILANAGLKGSVAGTSLVAMFNQITKPSQDVQKAFGGMNKMIGLFTDKTTGKMKDLPELIEIIGQAADQQGNDFMKMAFLTDFVGVEGAKAFSALRRAVTAKDSQGRPMFQGLREDIKNSAGAAKEMADKRLNTLQGVLTMIHHEVSAVAISIGKLLIPELRQAANVVVDFARQAAKTFIAFGKSKEELTADDIHYINSPMGQFIKGFIDGIKEAVGIFKSAFAGIKAGLAQFGIGVAGSEEETGRLIGKFLLLSTAIVPLLTGLVLVNTVIGSVMNTFLGLGNILMGAGKLFWNMSTIAVSAIRMMGSAAIWLVTNPIGWWILGIAAVVAAGWFLYKNWGNIWGATKQLFSDGIDWIVGSFKYLINWFKNASIGEIIAKTLLAPIRVALTPIMELIQWIMSTGWVKNMIGADAANMIKNAASYMSVLPDMDDIKKIEKKQSVTAPAQAIATQAVESQRLSQAPVSQAPTQVSVQQQPILVQVESVTKLDGREINRSVSKQQMENSERAGMSISNPKNKQLINTNGGFTPGFSR